MSLVRRQYSASLPPQAEAMVAAWKGLAAELERMHTLVDLEEGVHPALFDHARVLQSQVRTVKSEIAERGRKRSLIRECDELSRELGAFRGELLRTPGTPSSLAALARDLGSLVGAASHSAAGTPEEEDLKAARTVVNWVLRRAGVEDTEDRSRPLQGHPLAGADLDHLRTIRLLTSALDPADFYAARLSTSTERHTKELAEEASLLWASVFPQLPDEFMEQRQSRGRRLGPAPGEEENVNGQVVRYDPLQGGTVARTSRRY